MLLMLVVISVTAVTLLRAQKKKSPYGSQMVLMTGQTIASHGSMKGSRHLFHEEDEEDEEDLDSF
jgi:hypothetical protein